MGRVRLRYQAGEGPPPKSVVDRLATRLPHLLPVSPTRVPNLTLYGTFIAVTLWSGGRCRLAHLVLALHPTGSRCAEPPDPPSPEQTRVPIPINKSQHSPVLCLQFLYLLAADLCWLATPFRPPGAGNRPLRDFGRGHHTLEAPVI